MCSFVVNSQKGMYYALNVNIIENDTNEDKEDCLTEPIVANVECIYESDDSIDEYDDDYCDDGYYDDGYYADEYFDDDSFYDESFDTTFDDYFDDYFDGYFDEFFDNYFNKYYNEQLEELHYFSQIADLPEK